MFVCLFFWRGGGGARVLCAVCGCTMRDAQPEVGVCGVCNRQGCAMTRHHALQMLLASPHRTMDPEEAELFFVPAYTSCYAWPVHGWADYPWFHSAGGAAARACQQHTRARTHRLLRC
jgi:hypothetical protein